MEMTYAEYVKHRGYYPNICLVDWERWSDEICVGCEVDPRECPEDFFSKDCWRHDEIEELDQAAFEANENIRIALGLKL